MRRESYLATQCVSDFVEWTNSLMTGERPFVHNWLRPRPHKKNRDPSTSRLRFPLLDGGVRLHTRRVRSWQK